MLVSINRDAGWTLGFANPIWKLRQGQEIQVSITFDGHNQWSGSARAMNETFVIIPMPMQSTLISSFRGAYQMQVLAVEEAFLFNLDGTSRLMAELAQCVSTQLTIERGDLPPGYVAAPFKSQAPHDPPTPSQPSAGTLERTATRIASNLLLPAKLPNARLLSAAETPANIKGHGAAWMSDAGIGAVQIISASAAEDAQLVASALIADDGAACKGDFASGRSSDLVDDRVITKAFTGCKDSGFACPPLSHHAGANDEFIIYALTGGWSSVSQTPDSQLSEAQFQVAAMEAALNR